MPAAAAERNKILTAIKNYIGNAAKALQEQTNRPNKNRRIFIVAAVGAAAVFVFFFLVSYAIEKKT